MSISAHGSEEAANKNDVRLPEIYGEFAEVYVRGSYPQFSSTLAQVLPQTLEKYNLTPSRILDVACGEGSFAVAMAQRGYQVTGIDQSPRMLALAAAKAASATVELTLLKLDMRALQFNEEFELATCWYDSLNYLLTTNDLLKTFCGVKRALKPNGLFMFDMNTIQGLAVFWQRKACYVQHESEELLELHRHEGYDFENSISRLHITGFLKRGESWTRFDEIHDERGYAIKTIGKCLRKAGFKILGCYNGFNSTQPPSQVSGRVWFITKRG